MQNGDVVDLRREIKRGPQHSSQPPWDDREYGCRVRIAPAGVEIGIGLQFVNDSRPSDKNPAGNSVLPFHRIDNFK